MIANISGKPGYRRSASSANACRSGVLTSNPANSWCYPGKRTAIQVAVTEYQRLFLNIIKSVPYARRGIQRARKWYGVTPACDTGRREEAYKE